MVLKHNGVEDFVQQLQSEPITEPIIKKCTMGIKKRFLNCVRPHIYEPYFIFFANLIIKKSSSTETTGHRGKLDRRISAQLI